MPHEHAALIGFREAYVQRRAYCIGVVSVGFDVVFVAWHSHS